LPSLRRSADFDQPRSYVEVDSIDETVAQALDAGATLAMEKSPISETSW
jgi:predicted enzyme related to lactoylglutathione lyase